MVLLSILVALGVVFSIIDGIVTTGIVVAVPFLTFLVPQGFKVGLANIVVMIVVLNFKFKDGLLTVVLKSFLVGFIFSSFSLYTFAIGFTGTILSFLCIHFFKVASKNAPDILILSVFGALTHTVGQIAAAAVVLYGWGVLALIPSTLTMALIGGFFMGIITRSVNTYLQNSYLTLE